MRSCISQNLPSRAATVAADAATSALGWEGRGKCLKHRRNRPLFFSNTSAHFSARRLQWGHSKSPNSTTVTAAFAGPLHADSVTFRVTGSALNRVRTAVTMSARASPVETSRVTMELADPRCRQLSWVLRQSRRV